MYAVTGITGKVGAAVARSLLSADQPVRAVVRDRGKGAPWADLGCDVAVADLVDAGALAKAFEGTDGVFAMLPPVFDPAPGFPEAREFIASMYTALAEAKPKKVVALSSIGADAPNPNLLNALGLVEDAMKTLPMPVAFLRAAWFMENAAWDIASAREGMIQSYLQPLDRPIPMIATDDVGRTAAALLQEHWEGRRVIELEGAQRVSPNALAGACTTGAGGSRAARSMGIDLSHPGHEESNAPHADARRIQHGLDRLSESRRERPQGLHRHRSGHRRHDPKTTQMNQISA
jgi:uncharacterized protein YbjT (DUF2867 family)